MVPSVGNAKVKGGYIPLYWWEHPATRISKKLKRLAKLRRPSVRNFGDLLSPLIVSCLSGAGVKRAQIKDHGKLLGLGSVLFASRDQDIIWGSGFFNSRGDPAVSRAKNLRFAAVRGPKTWEVLRNMGIDCPEVFGDPALLLPSLVDNDIKSRGHIGFIPHFSHYPAFRSLSWTRRLRVIDVEQPPTHVMRQILECDAIFSTSLHGVIVAEAYGIPARAVVFREPLHGEVFKFEDYYEGTGRLARFVEINRPKDLITIIRKDLPLPPAFRTADLIEAFPYPLGHSFESLKRLKWSSMKTADVPSLVDVSIEPG